MRVIKSRRMRWAGHVARMGEERGVYRVLVGKPEGKRPLGRPRRRWVDNIRMDLQEVGCGYIDWIGLAQDRESWRTLVSAVMNLRVPWNAGNFLTSCKPVSFSRNTGIEHQGYEIEGGGRFMESHLRGLRKADITTMVSETKRVEYPSTCWTDS